MSTTPKMTAYVTEKDGKMTVTIRYPAGIIPDARSLARLRQSLRHMLPRPRSGRCTTPPLRPLPSQGALLFLFRGLSCAQEDNRRKHRIYPQGDTAYLY